ncbi:MAG: GNAT family N-acetyltransferase [Bacteroidales bacterium]|nr:GNAT family N-acetyltransferase [Bacteroidales bacterium]
MDISKLEIRICNFNMKNDLDAVVDLLNVYIKDEMGGGTPIEGLSKLRLVDGLNNHPTALVLLAGINNVYMGLAVCFVNYSTFMVRKSLNIHDFIVHPKYRERGVGKALMSRIVEIATERNCGKITLEVREDNFKAQMLYNSLGFGECVPPMKFWTKTL